MHRRALAALLLLASPPAAAGWPDDVTLSSIPVHAGVPVSDTARLSADFGQLVRELGVAVASGPVFPAHTLGVAGFELSLDNTLSFIDVYSPDGEPSPWDRAHAQETPSAVMWQPGLTIRKGLPFSTELAFRVRWIGLSRQAVVSGDVRIALVEKFKPFPDVNLHLGYSGYVGNDELDLGVFHLGGTLGSTFHVGPPKGPRNIAITPYADIRLLVIRATPSVSSDVATSAGLAHYGSQARNPDPDNLPTVKAVATAQFNGGVELVGGKLLFRVTGGYALRGLATVGTSIGFVY
jgi:hypothetical protein